VIETDVRTHDICIGIDRTGIRSFSLGANRISGKYSPFFNLHIKYFMF